MNNSPNLSNKTLKQSDQIIKKWLNIDQNNQKIIQECFSSPNFSWRNKDTRIPNSVWQAMAAISLAAQLAGEGIEELSRPCS